MVIKNVIICGLGALGLTYACKLKEFCNLKILVDEKRFERFRDHPPIFNDREQGFEYILPDQKEKVDLIIICTKSSGLELAIEYIKNFVCEKTIIISLINGISSEEKIRKIYPKAKVLNSYFIGHSAMRIDGKFYQDGVGKIVFEPNEDLKKFFEKNPVDYEISENIIYSQWQKLGVNIVLNQLSAIYNLTVGELRRKSDYKILAQNLLQEVVEVASKCGIKNLDNYIQEVLTSANLIADDGITSMLQDVRRKQKTEVEIFSGEIIRLGEIFGIKTPYNEDVYNKIKLIEKEF